MHRQKMIIMGAAIFTLGVAFAAQPQSALHGAGDFRIQQVAPWVPGTNMLMSAHEPINRLSAPPR